MIKGIYAMDPLQFHSVYSPQVRQRVEKLAHIISPPISSEELAYDPSVLADVEVLFTGWGGPILDKALLDSAPKLRAVFYAAGSLKGIVTDHCWERDITFTSAYAANAVPVAEYTLSQILFSLKYGWQHALHAKKERKSENHLADITPGGYGATVGIISLGMIGRRVCELLQTFGIDVHAYDPYISQTEADQLNVKLCSLEEIFQTSDVVSLHTPWLKETEGMITGDYFEMMKPNGTFINTSRGAVVNEPEMIRVLRDRSDLIAVLDVTYPEPPASDSPLFELSNVILTPHIAGSLGKERARLGDYMLKEFERYVKGEPLEWQITKEKFSILA